MYSTYVLYSHRYNKIYIGFSGNLASRLLIHNDSRNSDWSDQYQPWVILYFEEFETKAAAMKREKELKTARGRKFCWEKVAESINQNQ